VTFNFKNQIQQNYQQKRRYDKCGKKNCGYKYPPLLLFLDFLTICCLYICVVICQHSTSSQRYEVPKTEVLIGG